MKTPYTILLLTAALLAGENQAVEIQSLIQENVFAEAARSRYKKKKNKDCYFVDPDLIATLQYDVIEASSSFSEFS